VAACLEGHRPLLVEVQALVGHPSQVPRRSVSGLDPSRVPFLLAVLDRRAGVPVGDRDVYVSVTGGVRIYEPATDLAVCLALASSALGMPLPADMVAVGEVGLGGEVRRVSRVDQRLAEAARVGFRSALLPSSLAGAGGGQGQPGLAPRPPRGGRRGEGGLRTLYATTLREALTAVLRTEGSRSVSNHARGYSDGLASSDAGASERRDDRGAGDDRPRPAAARGA
jgi:hypothetical protein